MDMHKVVTEGLVEVDDDTCYLDIEFCFSEHPEHMLFRLIFCSPSLDPVAAETMHRMIGHALKTLRISIVSFYNRQQERLNPDEIFSRPEGQKSLNIRELHYLYSTLVDFILKVADNKGVQILYFSADNESLSHVYDRYVKRFAQKLHLDYQCEGKSYAIQTRHYPG